MSIGLNGDLWTQWFSHIDRHYVRVVVHKVRAHADAEALCFDLASEMTHVIQSIRQSDILQASLRAAYPPGGQHSEKIGPLCKIGNTITFLFKQTF